MCQRGARAEALVPGLAGYPAQNLRLLYIVPIAVVDK